MTENKKTGSDTNEGIQQYYITKIEDLQVFLIQSLVGGY